MKIKKIIGWVLLLSPGIIIAAVAVWIYGIEAIKVYAVMAAVALIAVALIRCGARLIAESEK